MKTEIINTGTELLTGDTRNDNLVFLAGELLQVGLTIWRQTTIGDVHQDLKDAISRSLEDSEIIIITGGLGPTVDDISKETAAEVVGLELILHEGSRQRIEEFFEARGRQMPEVNVKQAMMPRDSIILDNDMGTAPGLVIERGQQVIIILPGPPMELRPMFNNYVLPYLRERGLIGDQPIARKIIKLWGIGESSVQEALADLHHSAGVEIGYQARRGEVWVKLTNKHNPTDFEPLNRVATLITERMGEKVFGFDSDTMELVAAGKLLQNELTISLAESCTGGMIAKKLTDLPGSSAYLMYGVVSYSNEAKVRILGVRPETLREFGAVSEETALEMAVGVRNIAGTDIAVSVTGIAGPDGGTEEKTVGLVYMGLAHQNGSYCRKHIFYGDRENIRELTSRAALNMVRLYISDKL